jgi:hypothetical protein
LGAILAQTGIAPIYFFGFSIFEPVGKTTASKKSPGGQRRRGKVIDWRLCRGKTTAGGIIGGQDDGRMTAVPYALFMDDAALVPASTRRITPRYGPSSWQ